MRFDIKNNDSDSEITGVISGGGASFKPKLCCAAFLILPCIRFQAQRKALEAAWGKIRKPIRGADGFWF